MPRERERRSKENIGYVCNVAKNFYSHPQIGCNPIRRPKLRNQQVGTGALVDQCTRMRVTLKRRAIIGSNAG
jgi:hypothetical protein